MLNKHATDTYMMSLSMLYFQKQIFVRKPISPALVIKHIFAKLEQDDAHCDADFQPCWPRCRIIKQIYLCLKTIKTLSTFLSEDQAGLVWLMRTVENMFVCLQMHAAALLWPVIAFLHMCKSMQSPSVSSWDVAQTNILSWERISCWHKLVSCDQC